MNKKISIGVTIALMAITAAITFLLTSSFTLQTFNEEYSDIKAVAVRFQKIDEVYDLVENNYYSQPDTDNLVDNAIAGYVDGLGDKYSYYRSQKQLDEAMDAAKGSISGIGISVKEDTDTGYIKIIEVMDDTFASGTLKVGDLIVEVDGQDVLTFATETTSTYSEALRQIRVRLYDGVELTVRRNNTDEKFLFTNRVVDDTNLLTGEVISGNIGYIKLNRFEGGIAISLPSILKNLGDVKGYVIDIRNNSGGYISEAESFADCFLGEGDYAQANYRDGHSEIIIHGNTSSEDMIDKPIIILVNGHTASSAELFASVMKDYRDAKLVGVKTFGKGIMQEHFNPDGGGSLQLTVATIHSLKSSSYHGLGLLPDYEISLPSDLGIAVDPGVTEEDTQLQKAIELLS